MHDNQRQLRVFDDEEYVNALTAFLSIYERIQVMGGVADAEELKSISYPDFVVAVVDIRMPAGGGVATLRWIGENQPQAKVVALSARRDPVARDEM